MEMITKRVISLLFCAILLMIVWRGSRGSLSVSISSPGHHIQQFSISHPSRARNREHRVKNNNRWIRGGSCESDGNKEESDKERSCLIIDEGIAGATAFETNQQIDLELPAMTNDEYEMIEGLSDSEIEGRCAREVSETGDSDSVASAPKSDVAETVFCSDIPACCEENSCKAALCVEEKEGCHTTEQTIESPIAIADSSQGTEQQEIESKDEGVTDVEDDGEEQEDEEDESNHVISQTQLHEALAHAKAILNSSRETITTVYGWTLVQENPRFTLYKRRRHPGK